jgi:CcmD family protein
MESNSGYLLAAFAVAWVVLGLYVWLLGSRLAGAQRQLEALQAQEIGDDSPPVSRD